MFRYVSNFFGSWRSGLRSLTLASTLLLLVLGSIISPSASYPIGERLNTGTFYFFTKHIVFCLVGVVLMFICSMQSRKTLILLAQFGFAVCVMLLVYTIFAGDVVKGANRWISTPFGTIQPSEITRPFYILLLSWFFSEFQKTGKTRYIVMAFAVYFLCLILLALEPDFGMSIMYTLILCVLIGVSNIPIKVVLSGAAALLVPLGIVAGNLEHVRFRLASFFSPDVGDKYQINRALAAIKSGGFMGRGIGESKFKFILPDSHNDFIFAIICEELGYVFIFILLAIYLTLLLDNVAFLLEEDEDLTLIEKMPTIPKSKISVIQDYVDEITFNKYFVSAVTFLIGIEVFLNSAVSLNIIPTKGMTMPFISYGGSSLVSHLILIGISLALTRKRHRFFLSIRQSF